MLGAFRQADRAEQFPGAGVRRCVGPADDSARQQHVGQRIEFRHEIKRLEHQADQARPARRPEGFLATPENFAAIGPVKAGEEMQQRGFFPSPIRRECSRSRPERWQGRRRQDLDAAVAAEVGLAQRTGGEQGVRHGGRPPMQTLNAERRTLNFEVPRLRLELRLRYCFLLSSAFKVQRSAANHSLRRASTGLSRAACHAGSRPASVEMTMVSTTIRVMSPDATCEGNWLKL